MSDFDTQVNILDVESLFDLLLNIILIFLRVFVTIRKQCKILKDKQQSKNKTKTTHTIKKCVYVLLHV